MTGVAKRLLDVVVGTALGLVALAPMIVLGIAVAMSLRASPLFVQHRVGRRRRDVLIVKLRTFPPSTPAYLAKPDLAGVRTTALCRFVRRHHLDELPQLWSVPFGKLSLVGPRPEMRFLHEAMDGDFSDLRTAIRPGLTGLWQISTASAGMLSDAPEYDRFYAANQTVRMDVWILWRSVLKVLHVGRLIDLSHVPRWTLPRRSVDRPDRRPRVAVRSADNSPEG